MNLLDIVEVNEKTTNSIVDEKKYRSEFNAIVKVLEIMDNKKSFDESIASGLVKMAHKIRDQYYLDCLKTTGELSKNPINKRLYVNYRGFSSENSSPDSTINRLFVAPKIMTSNIRKLSRIAEMVVIPFEYLNQESYKNLSYGLRDKISYFQNSADKYSMETYVVTPISNLSVQNMIDSYSSKQIVTNSYSKYFDMLELMLPVLILMNKNIKELGIKLDNITNKVNDLSDEMKSVAISLLQVQKQVGRIELETKERIKTEIETLRKEQLSTFYLPSDPMMFAVPKGTDITTDDVMGFIGPCWGPDFDPAMEELVKKYFIPNQRANLVKQILG